MLVTFDTNVWISALTFRKGNPYVLLLLAIEGKLEVAASDFILNETRRILQDKFHVPPEDVREAMSIVEECAHRVNPGLIVNAVPDDPDDNAILECALESGSECVVTGDGHLLRLGVFEGIRIVRPAELVAELKPPGAGREEIG